MLLYTKQCTSCDQTASTWIKQCTICYKIFPICTQSNNESNNAHKWSICYKLLHLCIEQCTVCYQIFHICSKHAKETWLPTHVNSIATGLKHTEVTESNYSIFCLFILQLTPFHHITYAQVILEYLSQASIEYHRDRSHTTILNWKNSVLASKWSYKNQVKSWHETQCPWWVVTCFNQKYISNLNC